MNIVAGCFDCVLTIKVSFIHLRIKSKTLVPCQNAKVNVHTVADVPTDDTNKTLWYRVVAPSRL